MNLYDDDNGRGASVEAVLTDLKHGKTFPCYLLCGEEEFRVRNALERITSALIPDARDRDLNLFAMDGENEDIDVICESLMTPPLLPGHKVVVVRETRLFQSKNVLPQLMARIRERLETHPDRAAADFMRFISLTGLQLDDLRDGGWRKIDDDAWQRIVHDDGGDARETWLPRAVELCVSRGAVPANEKTVGDEPDRLERILTGGMPDGNHLILTAETVDRRKKIFKVVASAGRVLTFAKVKGESRQQQAVKAMAAELLRKEEKRLSSDAWTILGQKTGFNLRESIGAIEKLITYVGESPVIEAVDVEAVIGRSKEDTVFDLTNAIAERNVTAALRRLKDLLEQGIAPLMILAMITREIRFLFHAKLLVESGRLKAFSAGMDYARFQKAVYSDIKRTSEENVEQIDLVSQHPFVIYQALKNTNRFTRRELIDHLSLLARADLDLKSTGQDPRLILEHFLVSICGRCAQ